MTHRSTIDDQIRSVALLDEPTRRRLYHLVARAGEPVGRDEAAASLGISRELAAFHLERLVAGGLLDTEYRRLTGRTGPGAGRPAKLYRRAEGDVIVTLPTRNYDLAADVMAAALEALGDRGRRAVAPVAHERGREEASHRITAIEPIALAVDPSRLLVDALEGAGYEPEVGRDGSVRLRNCPYDALARDHRDLTCGMSAAWAEGVVEGLAAPMRVELAPSPDRCCVIFHPQPRMPSV
jgi:predicted ArsR family transcriptional regulator